MIDPLALAHELAEQPVDAPLPPEAARWIRLSLRRWIEGDPLESAFRLDRASRLRARNRALLKAADILRGDGGSAWELAGLLEQAIARHERRIAPLLRANPQASLSPLDRALRAAFESGARMTRTQRKLYELLR